ncbi:hypothetical protein M5D96_006176 [Drosophila gunungcola]|uniref:Uncharacterized protein n=1 Tax=Drosophila gunungcola TaxID=103775 RepID=A0A9Q0BQ98_9MUSC|nr:hypothetical protein M5D96_006176 [Drosophila gunungcola]
MSADVLQLADYVERNGRNLVSSRPIAIRIGDVGEGDGNALEGHELNHSDGSVLVPGPLGGDAIGGLELEAVVAKRIGWGIPVVDGPGRGCGNGSGTVMHMDEGQEQHKLIGYIFEDLFGTSTITQHRTNLAERHHHCRLPPN